MAAKRMYTRVKRRGVKAEMEMEMARATFREARRALRVTICRAKTAAWDELVFALDEDLWEDLTE